jgi:hypothetical protein
VVDFVEPDGSEHLTRKGNQMTLSVRSLAIVSALLWGGGVLFVGLVNLVAPLYGATFLQCVSSIYPGFHDSRTFLDVLVGTGYALFDGAVGGALFGWLYNLVSRGSHRG